jgi:hypothetical protein
MLMYMILMYRWTEVIMTMSDIPDNEALFDAE